MKLFDAQAVGRHVHAVSLGVQVVESGLVIVFELDAVELIDDGTTRLVGRDQLEHLHRLVAKALLSFRRKIDVGEVLGEAAVVVDVALLDATPVELLGDDRIGDAETEQRCSGDGTGRAR